MTRYHDGTKHGFNRFARSLGYLDWATQPRPFRAFADAPVFPLFPHPDAARVEYRPAPLRYDDLFDRSERARTRPAAGGAGALGDLLRHALGLSAWKQFGDGRWSLRVNPSSGNLHPTEAYVLCGPMAGLADRPGVYHYAPDRHALERRCAFDADAWPATGDADRLLVVLTSVHWREAWKYGERAFRYCQHDLGHAVAAIAISASLVGWRARVLPSWSHDRLARLTGLDRDEDFADAEREEPGCLILCAAGDPIEWPHERDEALLDAVGRGQWSGRASRLSADHVPWPAIDEVAHATKWPGRAGVPGETGGAGVAGGAGETGRISVGPSFTSGVPSSAFSSDVTADARQVMLQRRSAVAFDGRSTLPRAAFFAMLSRVMPGGAAPWDALWWKPCVHLALFVHRVGDVPPGLYLLARDPSSLDDLRMACGRDFLWEAAHETLPFVCLGRGDATRLAARLSCDQDIASDGFFCAAMLARFDASLAAHGPAFYRHLFWETGAIGQVLYLEAEAAGARATGIGCFYDDPVHDTLGLERHTFQSLYHFTVGMPVEDTRLTTEPGYPWDRLAFRGSVR